MVTGTTHAAPGAAAARFSRSLNAPRDGGELADGIWDDVHSVAQVDVLGQRYAEAIARLCAWPQNALEMDAAGSLRGDLLQEIAPLRAVYHQVKQFDESLAKLRCFCFDVAPLPTFDPAVLALERVLDGVAPSPGGTAFRARLAPVSVQAAAALADYQAGRSGAAEAVVHAAAALDRFREESIRGIGPILFVRRPSFGATNAVSPFGTGGRGPRASRRSIRRNLLSPRA